MCSKHKSSYKHFIDYIRFSRLRKAYFLESEILYNSVHYDLRQETFYFRTPQLSFKSVAIYEQLRSFLYFAIYLAIYEQLRSFLLFCLNGCLFFILKYCLTTKNNCFWYKCTQTNIGYFFLKS